MKPDEQELLTEAQKSADEFGLFDDATVFVHVSPVASQKLSQVQNKEQEYVAGVLLRHFETGEYRVMDYWGRFWSVNDPE